MSCNRKTGLIKHERESEIMSQPYNSTQDTMEHMEKVAERLGQMIENLQRRGMVHDNSKLESPEKVWFDIATPKLKTLTYGTYEYQMALGELHEALAHHYQANSHHPEHFENGINGMTLLDVVEMICDWKAASERHADGNMLKSLEINRERFNISDQLYSILVNTVREMKWGP